MAFTITAENWQQIDKLEELRKAYSDYCFATEEPPTNDHRKYRLFPAEAGPPAIPARYDWVRSAGGAADRLQNNVPAGGFNEQSWVFFYVIQNALGMVRTASSSIDNSGNFVKHPAYYRRPVTYALNSESSTYITANAQFTRSVWSADWLVNTRAEPRFEFISPFGYHVFHRSGFWWMTTAWDTENDVAANGFKCAGSDYTPPATGWKTINGTSADIHMYPSKEYVTTNVSSASLKFYFITNMEGTVFGSPNGTLELYVYDHPDFDIDNPDENYPGGRAPFWLDEGGNFHVSQQCCWRISTSGEDDRMSPVGTYAQNIYPPIGWLGLTHGPDVIMQNEYIGPWIIDELKTALADYAP